MFVLVDLLINYLTNYIYLTVFLPFACIKRLYIYFGICFTVLNNVHIYTFGIYTVQKNISTTFKSLSTLCTRPLRYVPVLDNIQVEAPAGTTGM